MTAASDTIAAIATAVGGGVGIVRLSGPKAEPIARAVVPSLPRAAPSHRLFLGEARDPHSGAVLDEVLAVVMRAPRSYTGEDVAELHGHGGSAVLAGLLDAVLRAGARLATPGEFTRRALGAGKIDLSQAEAVVGLIAAGDARSLRAAQALRQGVLGKRVDEARRELVHELAAIEGALDFPDETADARAPDPTVPARLRGLGESLEAAAAAYRRPLASVPELLIVGSVNAGKSSLLNALVGHERALVDDAPGTTRDAVEAEIVLGGEQRVRLVDTAGLRPQPSVLEQRGQAIAEARRAQAALALVVYDGARGWTADDGALCAALERDRVPVLVVENKADLPRAGLTGPEALRVSARTSDGLDALRARIVALLALEDEPALPVASLRQASALAEAGRAIARAAEAWSGASEVAAVELRRGLHQLGLVTGETVDEEILDAIFARFCIGK